LGLGARGGDEVAATLAEEGSRLHAIRAALEDIEDHFECLREPPLTFPPQLLGNLWVFDRAI
jgi:acyl carrier protein phosphodiesterase